RAQDPGGPGLQPGRGGAVGLRALDRIAAECDAGFEPCAVSRSPGPVRAPASSLLPPDRAAQRRGPSLAMLFEAQLDRRQRVSAVCRAVHGEPPRQSVAPSPVAIPVEPTLRRVVERI